MDQLASQVTVCNFVSFSFGNNQTPLKHARKPSPSPICCNYIDADGSWALHFKGKHHSQLQLLQCQGFLWYARCKGQRSEDHVTVQRSYLWSKTCHYQTVMFTATLKILRLWHLSQCQLSMFSSSLFITIIAVVIIPIAVFTDENLKTHSHHKFVAKIPFFPSEMRCRDELFRVQYIFLMFKDVQSNFAPWCSFGLFLCTKWRYSIGPGAAL